MALDEAQRADFLFGAVMVRDGRVSRSAHLGRAQREPRRCRAISGGNVYARADGNVLSPPLAGFTTNLLLPAALSLG